MDALIDEKEAESILKKMLKCKGFKSASIIDRDDIISFPMYGIAVKNENNERYLLSIKYYDVSIYANGCLYGNGYVYSSGLSFTDKKHIWSNILNYILNLDVNEKMIAERIGIPDMQDEEEIVILDKKPKNIEELKIIIDLNRCIEK